MSSRARKGWLLGDRYAQRALGLDYRPGERMADATIFAARQSFCYTAIPLADGFAIESDDPELARLVSDLLISGHTRTQIWGDLHTLELALQNLVGELLDSRHAYLLIDWLPTAEPVVPAAIRFLAPETIEERGEGTERRFEQYVSPHADYAQGQERWFTFTADEIIHLEWPLEEPDRRRSPLHAALAATTDDDKLAEQNLYGVRAGAYPEETFLPLVRARAGAYRDALERLSNASDAAGDRLFRPPDKDVTAYFWADRVCRFQAAAATVRDCLIDELNRQLIAPWRAKNDWPDLTLVFTLRLWTAAEWRELRRQLHAGQARPADVEAAFALDLEARSGRGLAFDATGLPSGDPASRP